MGGRDPRNLLQRILYAVSADARKSINQRWKMLHGTPPPWTVDGARYEANRRKYEAFVRNPPKVEGDARWMTDDELIRDFKETVDFDKPRDFITMGHVPIPKIDDTLPVVSHPPGHLLTIAATRAGKGAAQIVPNLITYRGSMLVIDPKGENYAMTHQHRRRFSRVLRIDPFHITEAYDGEAAFSKFNPLNFVHDASEARRMANVLMSELPENDSGAFWHREAVNFLAGLIQHICEVRDNPTIGQIRAFLSEDEKILRKRMGDIAKNTAIAGVARAFTRFIEKAEKERSGVLSTLNADLAIWDEPAMAETVQKSHFDFAEMKGDAPLTVYVVLPFDKLYSHKAFLRLFVMQFYQAMVQPAPAPKIPVLCLIDEFPALGEMDELVKALGEVAGYGVRFWLFAQGLNQLKSIYPKDWETILAQCATQSFFGIADHTTAQTLADFLGQETVLIEKPSLSHGESGIPGDGGQSSTTVNNQLELKGVPLATPQEIRLHLGVGKRGQVVFQSGKPPVIAQLYPWFEIPELQKIVPDIRNVPVPPKRTRARKPKEMTEDQKEAQRIYDELMEWKGTPPDHKFGFKTAKPGRKKQP